MYRHVVIRVPLSGAKIQQARKRRGWTCVDLATALGVTPQTVYRWEDGRTAPPMTKAQGIALALGVSITTLVGDP